MSQVVGERTAVRTAPGGRVGRALPAPSAGRVRAPARAWTPPPPQPHEWRTLASVSLAVLVVLLLATWSFAQGWGRGPVAGPGELAVGSGLLRVDGVVSAARPEHAMPGMGTDEDPVPAGHRRVSVDVTLLAGASTLTYDPTLFTLTVDGEPADHLTHRDVLPVAALPAGTRLSGTMLFDVPRDATTATLGYDGSGATEVVLPPEGEGAASPAGAPGTDAGHGGEHHDATAPHEGTAGAGQ